MLKRVVGIIVILVLGLACSTNEIETSTNEIETQKEKIVSTTISVPTTTTIMVSPTTSTTTTSVSPTTSTTVTPEPPSLPNGRPELTGLDAPDPEVVISGDSYYLFATNGWSGKGFYNVPVWKSSNLESWEWAGDALPKVGSWAQGLFTWKM